MVRLFLPPSFAVVASHHDEQRSHRDHCSPFLQVNEYLKVMQPAKVSNSSYAIPPHAFTMPTLPTNPPRVSRPGAHQAGDDGDGESDAAAVESSQQQQPMRLVRSSSAARGIMARRGLARPLAQHAACIRGASASSLPRRYLDTFRDPS